MHIALGGAGGEGESQYYTTDSSTIIYQAFGGALGSSGGTLQLQARSKQKPSGNGSVVIDNTNRDAGFEKPVL
jgi:hypothetical protein